MTTSITKDGRTRDVRDLKLHVGGGRMILGGLPRPPRVLPGVTSHGYTTRRPLNSVKRGAHFRGRQQQHEAPA